MENVREKLKPLEEPVRRSLMAFQETMVESLRESNKNITGNGRKGDPFCVEVESLATLSAVFMWKVANIHKELGGLGKEIARWDGKAASWLLLTVSAYGKMLREERDLLKKSWLNTKGPGIISLRISQHLQKANGAKFKNRLLGEDENPGNCEENMIF